VTGEEVSAEDLGGARVHSEVSGVSHFSFPDEQSTIEAIRKLLSYLPQNNVEDPPFIDIGDDPNRTDDSLVDLMPDSPNKPTICRHHHQARGSSDFFDVQPNMRKIIVTGFARLAGRVHIGIIGNQAPSIFGR